MKNKIDRRTFIKLLALTTLSPLTLSSCKAAPKKSLTCSELLDYSLINYNDGAEQIAYVITDGYGIYYALELNDQNIDRKVIYDISNDKDRDLEKDVDDNFINALNISYMEPALISLEENIGPNYEYTAEELQANLDKIKEEIKVKPKILTK